MGTARAGGGRARRTGDVAGHGARAEHGLDDAIKVLVIEDEPLIRDIYAEFLTLLGHEADVTADGRDGLARFDPLVHKLVITDFLMPGLTGLEIAEAIQARSPTTPIVLISGSAEEPDERRAAEAGLRFLRKPVAFADFKATVAAAVALAGPAQ
jgi:two-component system, NarL family, capsular synthesis sensor histidine kinase RcsC